MLKIIWLKWKKKTCKKWLIHRLSEKKWVYNDCVNISQHISCALKVPGPISQNGNFYSNDASSPKKSWFQISVKSVKPFRYKKRLHILQVPIPYCVSLKVLDQIALENQFCLNFKIRSGFILSSSSKVKKLDLSLVLK